MRLRYLLALLSGCNVVQAACEIEPGHYGPKLSESAAKVRDDFYQVECIAAIVAYLHRIKWKPAKLDGMPIQALAYFRYDIRLR